MAKDEAAGACAGCGKPLAKDAWAEVALGPTATARLCKTGRWRKGSEAKRECELRAREKAERCPGCGAEETLLGTICPGCREAIARDKARVGAPVRWWGVYTASLATYLNDKDDKGSKMDLAKVLARACAGTGRVEHGSFDRRGQLAGIIGDRDRYNGPPHNQVVIVELTDDQAAALKQLLAAIERVAKAHHLAGRREGRNLILQLGRGELTVDDFEGRLKKQDEL